MGRAKRPTARRSVPGFNGAVGSDGRHLDSFFLVVAKRAGMEWNRRAQHRALERDLLCRLVDRHKLLRALEYRFGNLIRERLLPSLVGDPEVRSHRNPRVA